MVPGDIYIGKATLDQYKIAPVFSGAYDGSDDIIVEHKVCGDDAIRFEDFDRSDADVSPHEVLEWILKHEKECSRNDPNKKRTENSG